MNANGKPKTKSYIIMATVMVSEVRYHMNSRGSWNGQPRAYLVT